MDLNIVIFAYKRPDSLLRCVEAIKKNALSASARLVVCIDGPKTNAAESDIKGYTETVNAAKNIQGFKQVDVLANEANLGLVKQFFTKFDLLFTISDYWVVVEDDIVVGKFFLDYIREAFRRYGQSKKISLIHAYTYFISTFKRVNSCFFAVGSGNKAFGITKTFWQNLERRADFYVDLKGNEKLKRELIAKGVDYKTLSIDDIQSERIKAWDVILSMYVQEKKLLCLSPDYTLAEDAGWSADASNTFGENIFDTSAFDPDYRINNYPEKIVVDKEKEKQVRAYFKYTLRLRYWRNRIRSGLKKIAPSEK